MSGIDSKTHLKEALNDLRSSYNGVCKALDNMSEMLLTEEDKNKQYLESFNKLEAVYKEAYRKHPSQYESGYLDGLDRAIGILEEAMSKQ